MSQTSSSQQDGSLKLDTTDERIFSLIRLILPAFFVALMAIDMSLELYVLRYSLRDYIEGTQLYKQAQKSEIHGLLLSSLVKKAVKDHNEKQVLHKINIKTLTPEQFKAVLDPCTVWDYRERNKCQKE